MVGAAPVEAVHYPVPAAEAAESDAAEEDKAEVEEAAAEEEEEAAPAAEEDEEEEEPSQEALREELTGLQARLEEAMEAEDFDECDTLQTRIDKIEAKLADA
jgi:hypothetical protein